MNESFEDFEKYYKASGLHVRLIRELDLTVGQNMAMRNLLFAVWQASRRYEQRRKSKHEVKQ